MSRTELRLSGMEFHSDSPPSKDAAFSASEFDLTLAKLAELAQTGDLDARHALAWNFVATGDATQARLEFQRLSRHFDAAPPSASSNFHNDFGVALYECAKPAQDIEAFDQALHEFTRALEINPNHLEARFNRASLYQRLSLAECARKEWNEYLKREATSDWITEVRIRLANLDRPPRDATALKKEFDTLFLTEKSAEAKALVLENLALFCNYALDELLDRHLTQAQPNIFVALDAADFIAGVAFTTLGERAVADAVAAARTVRDPSKLIEARAFVKRGKALFPPQGKPVEAQAEYEKARDLFVELGDPYGETLARLGAAYCLIRNVQTPPIQQAKDQVAQQAKVRGYYGLLAQLDRFQAQLALRKPEYAQSLALCNSALEKFRALNDYEEIQKTLLIAGDSYQQEGHAEKAFASFQEILKTGDAYGTNPRRRAQACNYTATLCLTINTLQLARAYAQESLESSKNEAYANFRRRSNSLLALIEARSGSPAALESLARAQAALNETTDPRDRAIQQTEFDQTAAECYIVLGKYREANAACEAALTGLKGGGNNYALARLKELYGSARLQLGDAAGAERAFRESVDQLEAERTGIAQAQERQYFLHQRGTVYDRLAALSFVTRNDPTTAFEFAEKSKARTLLDQISTPGAQIIEMRSVHATAALARTPRLPEAQARIPNAMQILTYAVTQDAVLGWSITKNTFEAKVIPVSKEIIERQVRAFVEAASDPNAPLSEVKRRGGELHQLLIAPFAEHLDPAKTLCIIPDKTLHLTPWAAFVDQSQRWLIESYDIATAPSVALALHCLEIQKGKASTENHSLLAVGDPTFDTQQFPKLRPLDHARDEVRCIAQYFSQSTSCLGAEATKTAFIKRIGEAETIHIAAHCIIDRRQPLRSALAFAKDAQDSTGSFFAHEVYALRFPKTRLLVLSACESGLGAYFNGEGVSGIAHPFLARGVPTLIVSLWNVDDRATRELMCALYRARREEGAHSAHALRAAQLSLIRRTDGEFAHPFYWADFIVIGAPN